MARNAVKLEQIIEDMDEGVVSEADSPLIAGGSVMTTDLKTWLAKLHKDAYAVYIWDYTDEMMVDTDPQPTKPDRVEGGRFFGAGGDLSFRRDGDRIRWSFVGKPGYRPPTAEDDADMAWPATLTNPVYVRDRKGLLWGDRHGDQGPWFDNRVAGAALTYPVEASPDRVRLRYREYTQAGQVIAVWFTALEAYNG